MVIQGVVPPVRAGGLMLAALLVGCDHSGERAAVTAPPGGGGPQAGVGTQLVTAHGVGVVNGFSCIFVTGATCNQGGRGLNFSFDFSGVNFLPAGFPVPVNGTWSANDPATDVQLVFTGTGLVFLNVHQLFVSGKCDITTPSGGTLPGPCSLLACDNASNGAVDAIQFSGISAEAVISTIPQLVGACTTPLASGNIDID